MVKSILPRIVAVVFIVAILMPVSFVPASGVSANGGNNLMEASTSDGVSLHPYLTSDTASGSYQNLIYASGLMRRDPDTLELIPNMAESWEISDDFLTYTFTLRDDLMWDDGTPLTSADFKFTFDKMMDPDNEFPYRDNFDFIESYEAPDERTLVVKVEEKFCPALEGVDAVQPLPKHIWENLNWKDPEKNPEIMHPSVASGPFKLKEWAKDDHIIFEANDSYFRGRPKIDTYTIRIIPEQQIAYTMLLSGEVDWAPVTPEQYDEVTENQDLNVYDLWLARGSWLYIGFNLRNEPLQDIRVRHALSYALNKNQIVDKIMKGLAQRLYSTVVPTNEYFNPDVPHYDYDLEKAKELLEEAGYTPGPGGILEKDGEPLKLKLIYGPNSSKTLEKIAIVAQAQLGEVGVDVEIQSYEWGAFLDAQKKPPFDWDLTIGAWAGTLEPYWMNQIWSEKFIPALNHVAYVSQEVEDLFEEAKTECDDLHRIYGDIQRIIAEDSPYIFLFQNVSYAAINQRVKGIRPTPLGIGYNIHEWYIEEES
ncbi:MAG: ABC transporter substrate-binding protein [Anaerolineales bacterium]|nr:ABC transporter substrate-binding protein [Anaerolineales bacterium]